MKSWAETCVGLLWVVALVTTSDCVRGAGPAASAVAAALVKPGLWEITVIDEVPGSNTSHSAVSRLCFSAAAASDIRQILPPQQEPGMQCTNREPTLNGREAAWQITCVGKGMTLGGAGSLNLAGGGYQGRAELDRTASGSKPSKVVQTMSGRWLEDCK